MKVGDLVRWFESYADGISKSTGIGLLTAIQDYSFGEFNGRTFEVLRFHPHTDLVRFDETGIEKLGVGE